MATIAASSHTERTATFEPIRILAFAFSFAATATRRSSRASSILFAVAVPLGPVSARSTSARHPLLARRLDGEPVPDAHPALLPFPPPHPQHHRRRARAPVCRAARRDGAEGPQNHHRPERRLRQDGPGALQSRRRAAAGVLLVLRAFATCDARARPRRRPCLPRAWSSAARCPLEALLREDACAVGELIDTVDEAPLGAASTGQAHLATLRDGRRVVLKIQYPEAKGRFQSDFGNVQRLVRIALPALVPVIREVRRRFAREFEYDREAADLLECRASMRRHFGRRVALPDAYRARLAARPGDGVLGGREARHRRADAAARRARRRARAWLRATGLGAPPPPGAAPPTALKSCARRRGCGRCAGGRGGGCGSSSTSTATRCSSTASSTPTRTRATCC